MFTSGLSRYPARVKRRLIFPPAYPLLARVGRPDDGRSCKGCWTAYQSVGRFARDSLHSGIRFDGDCSVNRGGS